MIGPLLLLVSWLLLRCEGKRLDALGFDAPRLRLRQFGAGLAVAALAAGIQQLGYAHALGTTWTVNPAFTTSRLVGGLRWELNSVLFEELLFRGYLLYQAVRLLGERRAVLFDALAFGVYHWFSYGVLGNPVAMVFVLAWTGMYGWMFALAFTRTGSLALPLGLHLGWNLVTNMLFSAGPLGAAVLVAANGAARLKAHGNLGMLLKFVLPVLLVAGVWACLRRSKSAPPSRQGQPSQGSRDVGD
ncbi:CPBP family intramembrane metalloprotease [Massilia sp. IC2-477]|uniref:CPBP family intramembrane glutamic endopeptidase n=1 Tax=Massilia sp. IC2-477 TaxID=2887198 RepID=UPI001D1031C0|nr:CPBP family intramembrane glutamic endopeptidase [Massilia sp. IC2-477]MCC2954528.1 CPBP family intramembrane metalloprotease [Massilia sp. IC2-477]